MLAALKNVATVIILVAAYECPGGQIAMLVTLQLLGLAYIARYRPLTRGFVETVEILNELSILACFFAYMMMSLLA
jgi:hypothetical protein